jgi:CheY-like chemotaxis protein
MKPRVLFAEDDAAIRQSFAAILGMEGAEVTACGSAVEACQKLSAEPYDLVITDMRMESPTAGWSVVRAARAMTSPPIVAVMTAFPISPADLRRYHVETVLTKAMPVPKMLGRLRELIHLSIQRTHAPKNHGQRDHPLSRH